MNLRHKLRDLIVGTVLVFSFSALTGCADTKGAYKAADAPNEYAFVVSEHYSALLDEAANFVEGPNASEDAKRVVKQVSQAATPLVLELQPLAAAYDEAVASVEEAKAANDPEAVKAAQARLEAAARKLQDATTKAVVAVADFIRAMRSVRASPSAMLPSQDSFSDELLQVTS